MQAGYTENLTAIREFVTERYGNSRHSLTIQDVADYMGKSRNYIRKHIITTKRTFITPESLAVVLC